MEWIEADFKDLFKSSNSSSANPDGARGPSSFEVTPFFGVLVVELAEDGGEGFDCCCRGAMSSVLSELLSARGSRGGCDQVTTTTGSISGGCGDPFED
jgi:hypothetical protein